MVGTTAVIASTTEGQGQKSSWSTGLPSTSSSCVAGLYLSSLSLSLFLLLPSYYQPMVSSVSKPAAAAAASSDKDQDATVITRRPKTDENIFLFVPNLVGTFFSLLSPCTILHQTHHSQPGDQLGLSLAISFLFALQPPALTACSPT